MAAERFNKNSVQYRCELFQNGIVSLFNLASKYWYPKSSMTYLKGALTQATNSDKEFIEYCESKTKKDRLDLESIESYKQREWRIIYHDSEGFYDYLTNDLIMLVSEYEAYLANK